MKIKSFKTTIFSVLMALVLAVSLFSVTTAKAQTPPDIVDECGVIEGVSSDRYGIALQNSDVGFGVDSRFTSNKVPTTKATKDNWWADDRSYVAYTISGQNLVDVWIDAPQSRVGVDAPLVISMVGSVGTLHEVNNTLVETSSNWSRVKYTYIINPLAATVRVVFGVYVANDIEMWEQQITKVKVSFAANLPDADITHYIDKMTDHLVSGQRADVTNVSVLEDLPTTIGDTHRITHGTGDGDSYIDYKLKSQDTVIATFYEEILESGRPVGLNIDVKFSVIGVNLDVSATKTEVEPGRFSAPKRYTKITYTYSLPNGLNVATVRVNLPANTNNQQLQLGRVEIFDSANPPVKDSATIATTDINVSGWISPADIGQNGITDSIDFENKILEMLSSGINTILPNIWLSDTLEYRMRLLDTAQKFGAKAYVFDQAFIDEISKSTNYNQATAEAMVAIYKTHPAFIGHFIKDEPTVTEINGLEDASARYKTILPGKVFYVNLFPEHAITDYSAYLSAYFTKLKLDYISFDYYVLKGKPGDYSMKTTYLKNLDLVAKAAKANNAKMYTILGTTGHANNADSTYLRRPASVADVSFPAYAALAYGSKSITWFTYMAMNDEGNEQQYGMLDKAGNKTAVFEFAKTANKYIQTIATAQSRFDYEGTMLIEGSTTATEINPSFTAVTAPATAVDGVQSILSTQDIIAGAFSSGDDYGVMLSNYNDPSLNISADVTIVFKQNYTLAVYKNGVKANITLPVNLTYTLTLAPGEGVFIEMGAIEVLKATAKTEVNNYATAKGETNYSNAGWTSMQAIVAAAEATIDAATDANAIDLAVTNAKAEIDSVITLSAEQLLELKTTKTAAVVSYMATLTQADYNESNWTIIGNLKTAADAAITAATTTAAVNTAYDKFVADVSAVMTKAQEEEATANAPVYTDECIGNEKSGQRDDVYNLATRTNAADKVGDDTRIIFGANPGSTESYIDYKSLYQDTVIVIAYEQILEGNKRPELTNPIGFGVHDVSWNVEATDTKVVLGNYETGRLTKIIYTYSMGKAYSDKKIRIFINYGAVGSGSVPDTSANLETVQMGKVIFFNSKNASVNKILAVTDLENQFHFMGRSNYSDDGWDLVFEQYEKGIAAINAATSDSAVTAAYNAAIVEMGKIETADFQFNQLKDARKTELQTYATAKGEANYTAENWTKLLALVTKGKTDIDSASSESALTIVFNEAKDAIDKIEKKTSVTPPVDGGGNSAGGGAKKGCKSELATTALATILAILALTIIVTKKSKSSKTKN